MLKILFLIFIFVHQYSLIMVTTYCKVIGLVIFFFWLIKGPLNVLDGHLIEVYVTLKTQIWV